MMKIKFDRGATPWITPITHPVFPIALESLEMGYGRTACIYGCGGLYTLCRQTNLMLFPELNPYALDPMIQIRECMNQERAFLWLTYSVAPSLSFT